VDSRFRGNDDIQGARPRHRHSRESGNPLPVSGPWVRHFWICASGGRIVTYQCTEGDEAPDGYCSRRLREGWIFNVVGEENSLAGATKGGTPAAPSAFQYGNDYE
jgi:hypothetical protein